MSAKSILVCDDDEGIVDVASIILEDAGYHVIEVTESREIFDLIKKNKPDLILLDLWMPHVSGEEVTKQLKKNIDTNEIPIIIVSANRNTESIAKTIGADHFICKPFDIDELEAAVKQYVNS